MRGVKATTPKRGRPHSRPSQFIHFVDEYLSWIHIKNHPRIVRWPRVADGTPRAHDGIELLRRLEALNGLARHGADVRPPVTLDLEARPLNRPEPVNPRQALGRCYSQYWSCPFLGAPQTQDLAAPPPKPASPPPRVPRALTSPCPSGPVWIDRAVAAASTASGDAASRRRRRGDHVMARRRRHVTHGKLGVIHNTEALTSSSASLAAATSKTSPLTDPQGRPVSQSR